MKKAFDQTVRDLKREVNKKVLNVPGIEQKVLDSTSNEPWGPHGSHLADIAEATRHYHEYQIIMVVLWKRINDIGKNWRHVYKALTVLEYLVGHGSERVIDEIREHAYQISTLSHFQYIDSRGRDQGNNVRKKSQSLVSLVNDKERIVEVRQKAAANRDKFRSTSATGGMYRPSSYSSTGGYGDRNDDRFGGRYGYRDDDRNGYGREREREREWKYSDDDRYGRDGDRFGREYDERYRKDGFTDDEYRGRSRSNDDYQYMTRSRSSDRDRAYEDDGRYSSRSNGAKADHSPDEKHLERKFSEQNIGAPPSYEDTINDARSPVQDESGRDGETKHAPVPKALSPPGNTSQSQVTTVLDAIASPANQGVEAFHGFDPRSSVSASSAAPATDLIGSFSDSFSSNSLALVPVSSAVSASESNATINSSSGPTFAAFSSAPTVLNQPIENPFGDGPFNATPLQATLHAQPHNFDPTTTFHSTMNPISEPVASPSPISTTFDFGDTFQGITYTPPNIQIPSTNPQNSVPPPQPRSDALGNSLPQVGPTAPVPSQPNNIFAQTVVSLPPTMEPAGAGQPPKDKFEPKSTVWADTLSRGLVNLNISGSKINPLADIGVDFESINRKEKREKPVPTSVTSSIAMGKAMGSGSGIGRAGASTIRPSSNFMMGMGMGMNGPGTGGYGGGMSQPMGMGMGMGQGVQMRPPAGLPLGSTMPGGYNPMMSTGSYAPQQPYSGYR